jgi:hypothetical protein
MYCCYRLRHQSKKATARLFSPQGQCVGTACAYSCSCVEGRLGWAASFPHSVDKMCEPEWQPYEHTISCEWHQTSTPFHANGTARAHHFMRMAPYEHTISCKWHRTSTPFHANGTVRAHNSIWVVPYEHTISCEWHCTSTQFHANGTVRAHNSIWVVPYEHTVS